MKLKMEAGGVPVGAYTGPLVGVEGVEADEAKGYGPGIRWTFEVDHGPHKGQRASRITPAKLTEKNATAKLLAGMLGRKLPDRGGELDLDGLMGQRFLFVVAGTASGSTRVESATPPPLAG